MSAQQTFSSMSIAAQGQLQDNTPAAVIVSLPTLKTSPFSSIISHHQCTNALYFTACGPEKKKTSAKVYKSRKKTESVLHTNTKIKKDILYLQSH